MAEHLEQGVGGVHKTGKKGDHFDATGEGGIHPNKGKSTPAKGGKIQGDVPQPDDNGSHLEQGPTGSRQWEKTSVRGGGGRQGHDRTTPGPRAGEKETQQPGLQKPNLNKKHNYLGG